MNYQDLLWKAKAWNHNFINGDHNIYYFHRVAKFRAASKPITILYDGDTIITGPADIEVHVLNYFKSIFRIDNNCVQNDILDRSVPCLVSEEDNPSLLRLPFCEKIKDVVFDVNGDGGDFYIGKW